MGPLLLEPPTPAGALPAGNGQAHGAAAGDKPCSSPAGILAPSLDMNLGWILITGNVLASAVASHEAGRAEAIT